MFALKSRASFSINVKLNQNQSHLERAIFPRVLSKLQVLMVVMFLLFHFVSCQLIRFTVSLETKLFVLFNFFIFFLKDELFMHLTNYSINKHNENFHRVDSDDSGSKRYEKQNRNPLIEFAQWENLSKDDGCGNENKHFHNITTLQFFALAKLLAKHLQMD